MDEPFALTTADPRFDPERPVLVNGFLYIRAKRERVIAPDPPVRLVEGRRRRVVETVRS